MRPQIERRRRPGQHPDRTFVDRPARKPDDHVETSIGVGVRVPVGNGSLAPLPHHFGTRPWRRTFYRSFYCAARYGGTRDGTAELR